MTRIDVTDLAHILRDAAKAVAEALKVPRARVYDIALGLKRQSERDDG